MLNEPRRYGHSPIQIGLAVLVFGLLGVGLLLTLGKSDFPFSILFAGFYGIVFLIVLYSMTTKAVISDNEISAQTILGAKTLSWGEISRVSGRGYGIKLHNFDGDVTVAPSPQLPHYEEIVDWIGVKRPDLFNPLEYAEMKKGWSQWAVLVSFALVFVGMLIGFGISFLRTPQTPEVLFVPMFFVVIIAVVFLGMMFSSPQSLALNGKTMLLKYLFSEKTLLADEVASVDLRFTQTRNGKNYFILLTQPNRKSVRISGLSPSLPIAYLVLKNWHKKNTSIGLTNQRN
jgi:hypothetical protein